MRAEGSVKSILPNSYTVEPRLIEMANNREGKMKWNNNTMNACYSKLSEL